MPLLKYVNVKQGTRATRRFSNGNCLPLTQLPFAMQAYALQTRSDMGPWFYNPDDRTTEGIRLTHQPSPWIDDYTPLVFLPQRDAFFSHPDLRRSFFRRDRMTYTPAHMALTLDRYHTSLELVPTTRGARLRLNYQGDQGAAFTVFTKPGVTAFCLEEDGRTLTGSTNNRVWPAAENFKMYFAFRFSCPVDRERVILDAQNEVCPGAYLPLTEKQVEVRIAASYISREQALRNLEQETGGSFEELLQAAQADWERHLGRIELGEDTPEEIKRTFYTCLYRFFLYPHKFYELDEEDKPWHFCADTGRVNPGLKYVDNGFWDTFRTVYPMLSILCPEEEKEILEGFLQTYHDCGWLPKWPAPSEVGMMPGTLFEAVIADAAVKGILTGKNLDTAIEGMLKEATQESTLPYGRHGTADFNRYGYIPRDLYKESVSHTLDYVYGDFCIAQTLKAAGRGSEAGHFEASAKNYARLFDPETGFMRGRDQEGRFAPAFDACRWGEEYCEGGPWQSSFAVYHDYEGLAALYGGREGLIRKLDEMFAAEPRYEAGGYKYEIHEMSELAAQDFGQCAISNQPCFHIPWMFAELDAPEKTAYWLEKLCAVFHSGEEGFPGDEDNGSMSAWYLFAMLGFYPSCPGKDRYIAVPAQVNATLHLDSGDVKIRKGQPREKYIPHGAFCK